MRPKPPKKSVFKTTDRNMVYHHCVMPSDIGVSAEEFQTETKKKRVKKVTQNRIDKVTL